MIIEKFLYPTHPVHSIITGARDIGKTVFLSNSIFNNIDEYKKVYIYSSFLHQDFYQKLFKVFNNCMPIHIFTNILKEKDIELIFDEIVNDKDFNISEVEKKIEINL